MPESLVDQLVSAIQRKSNQVRGVSACKRTSSPLEPVYLEESFMLM